MSALDKQRAEIKIVADSVTDKELDILVNILGDFLLDYDLCQGKVLVDSIATSVIGEEDEVTVPPILVD